MYTTSSDADTLFASLQSRRVLQQLAISESGFLFDPASGQSYSINNSAQVLLRLLQQSDDLDRTVDMLATHYALPASQARVSVEHFLQQLARYL